MQGGGCSGFEYALGFDRGLQEGDHELETHGVTVVVDPFSAPYLQGAEVDFLNTITESGFKISNPNATSACGCGHSFQVEEGEELPEGTEVGGCGSGCSHLAPSSTSSHRTTRTEPPPLRVAVVGSGPAGFYAAGPLLAAGAEVDIIERLPTPWGLVRLGVAPDHPQLKTVSRAFEKIAAQPGFRFLGNVEVGRDLTHDDLVRLYDAVIYSYGVAPPTGASGSPARTSARLVGRDGARRLVQRPSRLPAARLRPRVGRARGGGRQRQRGARRRAHARPDAR